MWKDLGKRLQGPRLRYDWHHGVRSDTSSPPEGIGAAFLSGLGARPRWIARPVPDSGLARAWGGNGWRRRDSNALTEEGPPARLGGGGETCGPPGWGRRCLT
jgi:hypothetical protein